MIETILPIALVTMIGLFGWLFKDLLDTIRKEIHSLAVSLSRLAEEIETARKEFERRIGDHSRVMHTDLADLNRRLAVVEGRCQSEHGGERQRRGEDTPHRMAAHEA